MNDPAANHNNQTKRNGLFLKILIGGLTAGLVSISGGLVKLHSDVAVLQIGSGLEKRVEMNEALLRDIASDRDKRTIIIQGFRDDIADIRHRLEQLERRAR